MMSYMSVGGIEDGFAHCEVENISVADSKTRAFHEKPCFETDIPVTTFTNKGFSVKEGQIYRVFHNGESVDSICFLDEDERRRRANLIEELFS